jgi:uncharacterized protein
MTKTLYIHGLNSSLNEEKRAVLERFTNVIAPQMDYPNQPDAYFDLLKMAKRESFDYIIGSSMGGYMGYHLSLELGLPALLFNPALPGRSVEVNVPQIDKVRTAYLRIILGGHDDIVAPKTNLDWILAHEKGNFDIFWRNTLGHRIPVEVLEEEVRGFWEKIS